MPVAKCALCVKDPHTSDIFAAIGKCPECSRPCCKAHLTGWIGDGDGCSECGEKWRRRETDELQLCCTQMFAVFLVIILWVIAMLNSSPEVAFHLFNAGLLFALVTCVIGVVFRLVRAIW